MKLKYLRSIGWIIKLQWQTSRLAVIWVAFYSLVNGAMPIANTFIVAKLIAAVSAVATSRADTSSVYILLSLLLVLELVDLVMRSIDSVVRMRFGQKMELVGNELFFSKMYELSQEQFEDETFNIKLARAREGLFRLWQLLNELSRVLSTSTGFIGSIIAILIVAPWIGLIIVVSIIPVAFQQVRQNRARERIYKKTEPLERVAYRSRWMLIDPHSMPEIRLMNAFRQLVGAWSVHMKKAQDIDYDNTKKLAAWDAAGDMVQPVVGFGANIYFFMLLVAGGIGLDRFFFLRGMLAEASSGAPAIAGSVQRLHELSIDLQSFNEMYNTPPAIPNGTTAVTPPLTVEFKNVSFTYPGATQPSLDDVSFVLDHGSKTALVGENGAGKTTLIRLMLRQYLPTKGTILVNGIDIREIEQESYYAAISNLSQEFMLIDHLRIRDNITMGLAKEPTDQEIYDMTDMVDATKFVKALSHKLDTRLDTSFDDGTNLSGGQKQRLGIARALLRKADIMILDEPTSAIDARAEYSIFSNIYKLHTDKTILIVSHRFSTVRKADTIIVMEKGRIIQRGSHAELVAKDGLYKEFFDTQAEGYK